MLACIQILTDGFLPNWYNDRDHYALHFNIWLEISNFFVLFHINFGVDLDEIQYVATTCWFVEVHAEFILHK